MGLPKYDNDGNRLYSCFKCKTYQTENYFYNSKSSHTGKCSMCKKCSNERTKLRKREKILANGGPKKPGRKKKTREEKLAQRKIRDNANINTKLAARLRQRIKKVLQSKGIAGRSKYSENAGCKGNELKLHLESTWYNHPITGISMSWDNYGWGFGKWTIDHIRPIINFLKKGEDPRAANHYTNLQAMWFEENMKKGAKY